MPNRLIDETSPYLLQHAHNPVDWYPWGEEALAKASAEDKPILLSIGYSACHWCHVMEHESFEDSQTAALMNESFVNIKVDREERPDLDEIYMTAVQGLTGHGGWPMTVFLTPEGKPFFGGTYFPPTDRMGMPSFRRVLASVADAYQNRRQQVDEQAEAVTTFLRQQSAARSPSDHLDSTVLDSAFLSLLRQFDTVHGGFGQAPKFPQAMALEFLLRYYRRTENPEPLRMVQLALDHMACGGIYDQIGGGFHRYSVDERWLVPHFEKMLYDNALLARLYLHAYQVTNEPLYRRIVEETLDYVAREMRDPHGGFYSTLDADSEGEEGAYYLWKPEQVRAIVGEEDASAVCSYYGVTAQGNFEGQSILTRPRDLEAAARSIGRDAQDAADLIARARLRLLEARQGRVRPARDEKVLCAWNGLMLQAFAEAYRVLGEPAYKAVAEANAGFLLEGLTQGGRVLRSYRPDWPSEPVAFAGSRPPESVQRNAGRAQIPGYLEDFAALTDALLTLYQATFDLRWYRAARNLADTMIDLFWSASSLSFSDTARDAEQLVAPPREQWDNATPSGTSLACHALLQLWALTGNSELEKIARAALACSVDLMGEHAVGMGNLLGALDFYLAPPRQVAIIGDPAGADTFRLLQPLRREYLPSVVLAAAASDDVEATQAIPLLAGRPAEEGRPTAYVCSGFVCDLPTTDPEILRQQVTDRA